MNFESRVRSGLSNLLFHDGTQVIVDSISPVPGDSSAIVVRFHLAGEWASKASFSFPFSEEVPVEESLNMVRESISQSWRGSHIAPSNSEGLSAFGAIGD